jgi:hypothetical protein
LWALLLNDALPPLTHQTPQKGNFYENVYQNVLFIKLLQKPGAFVRFSLRLDGMFRPVRS